MNGEISQAAYDERLGVTGEHGLLHPETQLERYQGLVALGVSEEEARARFGLSLEDIETITGEMEEKQWERL